MFEFLKKKFSYNKIKNSIIKKSKQKKNSWFQKIKKSIKKTSDKFKNLFIKENLEENFLNELENILLTSDVGIKTTTFLINSIKLIIKKKKLTKSNQVKNELRNILINILLKTEKKLNLNRNKPLVITLVGTNGVGKTLTAGKLTNFLKNKKQKVLLASCDTFRAAAYDQLKLISDINNVKVISQKYGDPSSIAFDAIFSAKSKNIDNVIIDTAGRLTNQNHLMEELKKLKRVIEKNISPNSHEILLVIDANTGQNALSQIYNFNKKLTLTGIIITKLDSTAKGGILIPIAKNQKIPIYFIGTGEKINDLYKFKAIEFINTLIKKE